MRRLLTILGLLAVLALPGLAQVPAVGPTPGPPLPDLAGDTLERARRRLEQELELEVTVIEVVAEQPVGTVVTQTPRAGRRVARGSQVALQVSRGQLTPTPRAPIQDATPAASGSAGRWRAFWALQVLAAAMIAAVLRRPKKV